ncbi:abscisic acid-insensitive 5-like protein 2-like, partial [Trifolium medium]|nr:abscisic acid-insensitive 5-like protein 2-like [Trifolium medium]
MGSQVVGDNNENNSQFQPLARQNSMYNLTLDEVESQLGDLGKPLSSMNLDELLKNVWTVETNQSIRMENENVAQNEQVVFQRQPNLSLNSALSKKTVDEVWRDIQQSKGEREMNSQERQSTLGEMTLEDFLVEAGVVSVASSNRKNTNDPKVGVVDSNVPLPQFAPHGPWIQYAQPHFQHPQQSVMAAYVPSQIIADGQVAMAAPVMGNLSDAKKSARKRGPEDMVERTVERKQKRMIKNRESAARSRARKQ